MSPRRWRALTMAIASSGATALAILAVLALPQIAGIVLAVVMMLLALLLYREIERVADLRERAVRAERLLAAMTVNLEMAEAVDPVTHVANRFRLFERLQQEFRRSVRYRRPLSCILLDLDRFSTINDQFGEHFGDTVLAEFASLVARDLRDSDLAARYEGEAFAILLPETSAQQASVVAERIRGRLKLHVFSNGVVACSLSASFGIAGVPDARVTRVDDLVRLAAQALAEAKRRGRDRVVIDLPAEPLAAVDDLPVEIPADSPESAPQAEPIAPHSPSTVSSVESA
jgi:diguanylate cyclase (GGDEF)-like protein